LANDASEFPGIAFSDDGHWLATSGGNDVRVFDSSTWAQDVALPGLRIRALSWDPTGPRLATGSATGDAAIWEIPSGALARQLRHGGAALRAVAFSPDGKLVASGGSGGIEQIWEASSGALQSEIGARRGAIQAIDWDRASRLTVAAGASGALIVADAVLGTPVTVLEGSTGAIRAAHFEATSRRVVGASLDGTARVWDATSPYRRWGSPPIGDDCGIGTSLEPDARYIPVGCRDQVTRVWDTARDLLLAELPGVIRAQGDFAGALPAVSPGGDRAAIARGNTVEIYELPGGRLLRTIGHGAPVNAVAFAPAGHALVSGGVDGSLVLTYDDREPTMLQASGAGIDAAAILPDGRVVAADANRRLRIYDSGSAIADLEVVARVGMLRPSPHGRHLIAIPSSTIPSSDGKAGPPALWDLEHQRLIAQLEGHTGRVFSARWIAPDRLLTAGSDGMVRLWDGDTGAPGRVYRGGSPQFSDATISPDGSVIVAAGSDGALWLWDIAGRPLWTLQAHAARVIGVHFEGDDLVTHGFAGDVSRWALPPAQHVIEATSSK
jgi:WD40 repeat protein